MAIAVHPNKNCKCEMYEEYVIILRRDDIKEQEDLPSSVIRFDCIDSFNEYSLHIIKCLFWRECPSQQPWEAS